jgi:hypothetical protein
MRKTLWASACVLVLAGGVARADDAEAKAIIEKGIKAMGGADVIKKLPASSAKGKGKFYGMGMELDYTWELQTQMPDRYRVLVEAEGGGFKFIQVIKGDKAWFSLNGNTEEMSKEELAEAQEGLYAENVARLVPLSGEGFKLSTLGGIKIGDRDAVGVRVEHKGHKDVSLYFDKENGLLLRVERRAKAVREGGDEYTSELTLGDYKKVDGLQVAHKIAMKRDGKKYIEQEVIEIKPSEKLDDSVFDKP